MITFIVNFNRFEYLKNTLDWCLDHDLEPIVVDNHSTYPPLLDYYADGCPVGVIRCDKNYGKNVVWRRNILQRFNLDAYDPYIVTDPDLDFTGIPEDFLQILQTGLDRYVWAMKCGFSLEINDVTDQRPYFNDKTIQEWEQQFWSVQLDDMYFDANVDTTFALYRNSCFSMTGLRTSRPYTVRHLPWYNNQFTELSEEELYYRNTASKHGAAIGAGMKW